MPDRSHAIVLRQASPPSSRLVAAELRLAGLLFEVAALENEVERTARDLASFERRYRDATSAAFAELDRSQRLLRRVRRLEDELVALSEELERGPLLDVTELVTHGPPPHPRSTSRPGRRSAPQGRAQPAEEPERATISSKEDLKALYRRLARALHPDLAMGDERERARRSDLMSRANTAYRRRDRAALELLAERVGAASTGAELSRDVSEEERLARVSERIAAVEAVRAKLWGERERLGSSVAARLLAEEPRRRTSGGDLFVEAIEGALVEARQAREQALSALDRVWPRLRRVAAGRSAWRARESGIPDPVAGSPLLRREPEAASRRHAAAASRKLEVRLETLASTAPWKAALLLLAFTLEVVPGRPDPLSSWATLCERWEAVRRSWPSGAPDLGLALAHLPRQLEFGLRLGRTGLDGGLQLASAKLAAGVRAALRRDPVRSLAQSLLAALGPRERCPRCDREVYAIHLFRVRGVDEVHGLACPDCAALLKSFRRYGRSGGIESLAGAAVDVGLVCEEPVRFGRASLSFGMLPAERARLTARALLRRFSALCLDPHAICLPRGALGLRAGKAMLAPGARVPDGAELRIVAVPGTGVREASVLADITAHLRGRFRGAGTDHLPE